MGMNAMEWVQILLLGAVLGAAGQVIRAMAGLKKVHDEQARSPGGEAFSATFFLVSVLIGAVAGVLGALALDVDPNNRISKEEVIALIGVGYAGADFIEAFMAKAMPAKPSPVKAPPEVVADAAAASFVDARAVG